MKTHMTSTLLKQSLIPLFFLAAVVTSATASATSINFDTMQDGTSYGGLSDSFAANEYPGVTINDSDPALGSTFVNLTDPINVGSSISGYYVNIGAFAQIPQTQLSLNFTNASAAVSFDYANPSGHLAVTAFDISGASLGVFDFFSTGTFVNQAGFTQKSGHVDLSSLGNIGSVLIEPDLDMALIVDNLNFRPVPLPAAAWLFISGLAGLIGFSRSKA